MIEFFNRQSETDNGEGLVIDRAGTTPPDPPLCKGGKTAQRNRDERSGGARPTLQHASLDVSNAHAALRKLGSFPAEKIEAIGRCSFGISRLNVNSDWLRSATF